MRGALGVVLRETFQGLADDFEVAFHGLPQKAIAVVVLYRLAAHNLTDEIRGVANVLKQLGRFRLHKRAGVSC